MGWDEDERSLSDFQVRERLQSRIRLGRCPGRKRKNEGEGVSEGEGERGERKERKEITISGRFAYLEEDMPSN